MVRILKYYQKRLVSMIWCFYLDFDSFAKPVFSNQLCKIGIGFVHLEFLFSFWIGLDLIFTNLNTNLSQLILSFDLLALSFFSIGQKFFLLMLTGILVTKYCSKANFEFDLEGQHDLQSIHDLSYYFHSLLFPNLHFQCLVFASKHLNSFEIQHSKMVVGIDLLHLNQHLLISLSSFIFKYGFYYLYLLRIVVYLLLMLCLLNFYLCRYFVSIQK